MARTLILTLVWIISFLVPDAWAQDPIFKPLGTHSDESDELIRGLRDQYQKVIGKLEIPVRQQVRQIYFQRTNELIKSIRRGIYIQDSFLQDKVDYITDRLIHFNRLKNPPERVLIQKNPIPNALCFGEGTFVVTVGLLSNISNESQLAFALAHEMAHLELDHVHNRIIQQVERDYHRKAQEEMTKILSGSGDSENVAAVRSMVYSESRFNRELEFQADSLGFILFRNAGYNEGEALELLTVLDSTGNKPPVGPELFLPFHTTKYPFREEWQRPRLRVYRKTYDNTLFFSNDSITTHPDIGLRRDRLGRYISHTRANFNYQGDEDIAELIRISSFEAVESAYFLKQFDRCLYLALRLWTEYPGDSYLVAVISRVLIDLYEAKGSALFPMYVPKYTGHYQAELRRVNDFLNTITREEYGEIAYNFLNSALHFDERNEEHYYLLWKLSGLTDRKELQKKVRQAYRSKFGKADFNFE